MELRKLGFDEWFMARMAETDAHGGVPARVMAADRGSWLLGSAAGEMPAGISGRLSFRLDDQVDRPCVGDWVIARPHEGGGAIIDRVLPRRTFLRRRAAGTTSERQMIAANIDVAFLVQACRYDFNPSRLERYLVMAAEGNVKPIVVLTKTDLLIPEELDRRLAELASVTRAETIATSCVDDVGLDKLHHALRPGKTYCLLGSSGVGKTTLLNRLLGREAFATRAVSGTGEGTHTTTRRQLVVLDSGALFVDTPGMRELGVAAAENAVDAGCADVAALAARCRYADCRHEGEPGCAVRAALERGELSPERFANYVKLRKESAFNELTVLGRRRRDKAFGRMIKAVKKDMRG